MLEKFQFQLDRLKDSLPALVSKRNLAGFLILGIAVLSIPIGVELVQTQQTLKSQAANGASCEAFKLSEPQITASCASCLTKQRPGLIEAIKGQHSYAATCDPQALLHLWCNGGSNVACTGRDPGESVARYGPNNARDGDTWGCTQGKDSYNTSPAATRQCIDTMSGICFQECHDTIYDQSFGKFTAVAEGFPQQPLEPFTDYEVNFCETGRDNSVQPEHSSLRRDSALQSVVNAAVGAGQCGGFTSRWKFNSGGPGLHSLQFSVSDTSLYEHPPGGEPLGQSNQPSSRSNNAPSYRPRAVGTDIVYEVKGKDILLPEGKDKVGYNSCAYNIGGQQNDIGTECALCLESKKPGLSGEILNLNYNTFRACTIRELENKWCNDINPTACGQLKAQCGTICGVNPTSAPTSTGSTPTLTATPTPSSLSAPTDLRGFCLSPTAARIRWSRVPNAEYYEVSIIDHQNGSRDVLRTKTVTDPSDPLTRPFVDFATTSGMTHSWTVKAVSGAVSSTISKGIDFGCS